MQIFLLLRTDSSSKSSSRGFTLVELLVSIAIIGIVTAIVLVRNTGFDSASVLKGSAYEVALALRETQARSVSSLRMEGDSTMTSVQYPYGLSFSANDISPRNPDKNTYLLFQHPYEHSTLDPYYRSDWVKATTTLPSSVYVYDVCVTFASGDPNCSIDRLDISFRRPNFNSLFYAVQGMTTIDPATITGAQIKLKATRGGANVFVVNVSKLGQMYVSKE